MVDLALWQPLQWPSVSDAPDPSTQGVPEEVLRTFALRATSNSTLLVCGTNSINWRLTGESGDTVLRQVIGYDDFRATEQGAFVAYKLGTLGIPTRRPRRPSGARHFTFVDSSGGHWQAFDFLHGTLLRQLPSIDFEQLGAAVGHLHRAFECISRTDFAGHWPYWQVKDVLRLAGCESLVQGLSRTLVDPAGVDETPMHGDLHADNVLHTTDGRVAIFDFDVVRWERNGRLTDLGILLHRAVRSLLFRCNRGEREAVCRAAMERYFFGYRYAKQEHVDATACIEAALLESAKKHAACKLGLLGASRAVSDTFASNHLAYVQELRRMIQLSR